MKISRPLLVLILYTAARIASRACDLCGCYTPQLEARPEMTSPPFLAWAAGSYVAVSEQFTHFGTLQFDGNEIGNPTGQYENSSITQLVAGYSINSRFALQLALPLIYRDFKRPDGFAIEVRFQVWEIFRFC